MPQNLRNNLCLQGRYLVVELTKARIHSEDLFPVLFLLRSKAASQTSTPGAQWVFAHFSAIQVLQTLLFARLVQNLMLNVSPS
jgi:hypothetical protein